MHIYVYIFICINIYLCGITIVHKRVLNYYIYIGGKSKIITLVRNENTKFWYLKFHVLRQSSVKRYNVCRRSYIVIVSKQKVGVIFVLSSQKIFPAMFSNKTVALSCSISVLKTIHAKHKLHRPKRGLQWEYSEEYHSENITLSSCYHAVEG